MPTNNPSRPEPSGHRNTDISERGLLQSVVEVARSVFGAAAASVFMFDPDTSELVFEAVCGEGEDRLIGTRFPSGTGIVGWVAECGQPLLIDDIDDVPQFARGVAESTGYVPRSIMAAPLILDGECVGVVEVLDRGTRPRGELGDVELLGLLSTELAMGLDLLAQVRCMRADEAIAPASQAAAELALLRRVVERLPTAEQPVATAVKRLLAAADELLAGSSGVGG